MELYIFRHAEAIPVGQQGITSDYDRPLTEKGRTQSNLAGKALKKLGVELDLIVTSPLVRAVETAEFAARELGLEDRIVECEAVATGEFDELFAFINRKMPVERVCLVGHEPTFGDLVGSLVWGRGTVSVPLKKAGIARVDVDGLPPSYGGRLAWVMTGKQVGLLGRQEK